MPDIEKADPKARRRAIAIVAGAVLIGGVTVYLLEKNRPRLAAWFEERVEFWLAHPEVIAFGCFVLMLPVIGVAIYLWRFGATVVAAKRFPPPGIRVVRDTVILLDARAIYRGRLMQVLSVLLLVSSVSFPVVVWYVLRLLGNAG